MVPEPETEAAPHSVLVIEDELYIRLLLADELREAGFRVVEAAHADEALAWLRAGGEVDLVFSDITMPGALNGLDLARWLRENHPALPVILTSGNAVPRREDGLAGFIPKPYSIEDAVSLVRETLSGRRPVASPDRPVPRDA
jgi:DNA-binding NtrC family response regulator